MPSKHLKGVNARASMQKQSNSKGDKIPRIQTSAHIVTDTMNKNSSDVTGDESGDPHKDTTIEERIKIIQREHNIVGRDKELRLALLARLSGRHLLLEGDVGVGKTTLALAIANHFHQPFFRIDGDERFTEAKLVGYFDPPRVLEHGYTPDTFISGPLTAALKEGGILFLNELNRLPEGTQNTLLPALDEGIIQIPKLPPVHAQPNFFVIATQNPQEHVGTTRLSEALRDRFTWIPINYQDEEQEQKIVRLRVPGSRALDAKIAVLITRATRNHPSLRRGASVRGAIDLAALITAHRAQMTSKSEVSEEDWVNAVIMALATKIDREDGVEVSVTQILQSITRALLRDFL
ncbi:MAG: AAA family ATPase [Candidatus Ranarchaeia archaeon]